MLFWILLVLTAGGSLFIAVDEIKNVNNDKFSKVLKNFLINLLGYLTFFGSVGLVIFLIIGGLFADSAGDKRVIRNVEFYNVADNSKLDTKKSGHLSFTSVEDDGNLVPITIIYDTITLETITKGKFVTVIIEDQYHTWFAPWNLNTFKHVILV